VHLFLDNTHNIKNIASCWKSSETFCFPDFIDVRTGEILYEAGVAVRGHLKALYIAEKGLLTKTAPDLTRRGMVGSSLEAQNVKAALGLFSHSTCCAIELRIAANPDYADTARLCRIVNGVIIVWNAKTINKGVHKRTPLAKPIKSMDDPPVRYLENSLGFFERWSSSQPYSLTHQTRGAIILSIKSLLSWIEYRLAAGDRHVLCGLTQTDPLEGHFGQVRML
jgi:hypothetical protein